MHFIGIKFYKTAFKFFQGFGPCFLVRQSVPCDCSSKAYGVPGKICFFGLGRMMFSFLLRPEFLYKNKSLNSVTVYPFKHLKSNSVGRSLYIVSRLSHPVRIKTSSAPVSHGRPYTIRPALAWSFSRLSRCVLLHDPHIVRLYVTDGSILYHFCVEIF